MVEDALGDGGVRHAEQRARLGAILEARRRRARRAVAPERDAAAPRAERARARRHRLDRERERRADPRPPHPHRRHAERPQDEDPVQPDMDDVRDHPGEERRPRVAGGLKRGDRGHGGEDDGRRRERPRKIRPGLVHGRPRRIREGETEQRHERRPRRAPRPSPAASAMPSDRARRSPRPQPILRADVTPDARDRPHLERCEDAPERPLDRAADLHGGERRLAVVTEHRPIDDEDERLQERAGDRRERRSGAPRASVRSSASARAPSRLRWHDRSRATIRVRRRGR